MIINTHKRINTPKGSKIVRVNGPRQKWIHRRFLLNPTKAEAVLWERIRRKRMGARFVRQKIIFNWVFDFYCHKASLIVEVDGPSHRNPKVKKKDRIKERVLRQNGYSILRFTNEEVIDNLPYVAMDIRKKIRINLWRNNGGKPFKGRGAINATTKKESSDA